MLVLGLLMVTLAVQYGYTAPSTETAECTTPKDELNEVKNCCKIKDAMISGAVEKCTELVKNVPANGTERRELKPEGFDCFDDCVLVSLGFMGSDRKIDFAKIKSGEKAPWIETTSKGVDKCSASLTKPGDLCPSGADNFNKCLFRELYMNCPEEVWTKSDVCQRNIERLKKCPTSVPFHCTVFGH
ncbi:odorant-Hypothetical protein protein 58c [Nesidiocoris tenuis]|uniref:Uncharacterized protein n=1 Tax=Nesidiocoris tenuis TaxID=355587 RepID=A0ABN7ATP6_9HEMI|nr:odorant-Hypothetical protein protein 58c [Nesidiocoris tenuis]